MNKKIEETREDLYKSRLIFVRALDAIIPEGKGVFLNLEDTDLEIKRMIVHKRGDVIGVIDASERLDLKNGDWVSLINKDLLKN